MVNNQLLRVNILTDVCRVKYVCAIGVKFFSLIDKPNIIKVTNPFNLNLTKEVS